MSVITQEANKENKVLQRLGYRVGSHDETHEPLRAVPFGRQLAIRAAHGDVEAIRLLSHEVLHLIPEFLAGPARETLLTFIESNPERFPRDGRLNQQARHVINEAPCYLSMLERATEAILAYRKQMAARHPYFRQSLTYSKLPGSHVGWMGPVLAGVMNMPPHVHGGVILNAVYYLQAPEPDTGGLIRFGGVAHDAPAETPSQLPLTYLCPPSNSLLIFPAYMVHGVTDYLGTELRRSISMGM